MAAGTLEQLQQKMDADPALKQKVKDATSIRDLVDICQSVGIQATQAQFLKEEAERVLQLSDAELESVRVNASYTTDTGAGCITWVMQCCG